MTIGDIPPTGRFDLRIVAQAGDGSKQSKRRATLPPVAPSERRALLQSAAVLIEEALRLLDQGGSSIAGVWLSHAAECLEAQLHATS